MNGSEIAIVGMSGRFPSAKNVSAFWENLKAGKHAIKSLTTEEVNEITDKILTEDKNYVPSAGGYLDDTQFFDHKFFNYSPREAQMMDPQIRILHECIWSALEDASYDPLTYPGLIGLFAGASGNQHWVDQLKSSKAFSGRDGLGAAQYVERDFLTTLISYNLNLRGPSYTIQTACSTSLVAVHQACQSLLNGECDIAVAGGVSIAQGTEQGYVFREGSVLSPDGFCRAFDESAEGCIYGSGTGVVVLRFLEDAINDNDHIYAVIKGSAINNDGNRKVGYTAPSVIGQAEVIRQAHQVAEVAPEDFDFIEAHGTGTKLGDPVEFEALKMVFGTDAGQSCGVGSVKTNIGHLDAAAGVAGLIKAITALQHKQLPPSLNFKNPNPALKIDQSRFYINESLKDLKSEKPLLAGVSSFGIGGTNAHVIVQEFVAESTLPSKKKSHLLKFSAKTESALLDYLKEFKHYLENTDDKMEDIAYTLDQGRGDFSHRLSLVGERKEDFIASLSEEMAGSIQQTTRKSTTVFMFPGQGTQYVNMSRLLYQEEPKFRETLDRCFEIYEQQTATSLKKVWAGQSTDPVADVNQTRYTQPLIFSIEYSLGVLLEEYGIRPDVVIGHSIGEFAAACLIGLFSLPDAIKLVVKRATLMQGLPKGSMLSVMLNATDAAKYTNENISLAAFNEHKSCVLSGPDEDITGLQQILSEAGVASVLLHTSHAFHSSMMDPVLEEFAACVKSVDFQQPVSRMISSMTGQEIVSEQLQDPQYWADQLRNPVRFADALAVVLQEKKATLLEVGPGHTLSTFARKHPDKGADHHIVKLIPTAKESVDDSISFYKGLGHCWQVGLQVDMQSFYGGEQRKRLSLPTYQFDKTDVSLPQTGTIQPATKPIEDGRQPFDQWFYQRSWEQFGDGQMVAQKPATGKWLLLIDQQNLLQEFKNTLPEEDCVIVQSGDSFLELSNQHYVINPTSAADYERLITCVKLSSDQQLNIVHGFSLQHEQTKQLTIDRADASMQQGFFSVINLIKAIGAKVEK
ncbi:MAG: type I polyketide synthase, partial [Bacteroidota bacterium]